MGCRNKKKLLESIGADGLDSAQTLKAVEDKIVAIRERRNIAILNAVALKRLKDLVRFTEGKYLESILDHSVSQDVTRYSLQMSVETNAMNILAKSHRRLMSFMHAAQPGRLGFLEKKDLHKDVARAYAGEKVDDPNAKIFANELRSVMHYLRTRLSKSSGIEFKKRKGVDLPTYHDNIKINNFIKENGFDKYWEMLQDWLDFDAMEVSPQALHDIMKKGIKGDYPLIDKIIVNLNKELSPGKAMKKKVAGRHLKQRFFIFKDADSWIDYSHKFGNDQIYPSIIEEIEVMSREIALTEHFGPTPELGFEALQTAGAMKIGGPNAKHIAKSAKIDFRNFTQYTQDRDERYAIVGSVLRNYMSAIHLGSAPLAAVADTVFVKITNDFNGMPSFKHFQEFIGQLSSYKKRSTESGIYYAGMEHAISAMHTALRLVEIEGTGFSGKLSTSVIRLSGLNPWTVAHKTAFSKSTHLYLGDVMHNKKKWNKRNMAMFERYGITAYDLNQAAKAGTTEVNGARMPNYDEMPDEISDKFIGMVVFETRMAVPEQTLRGKRYQHQGTTSGSGIGEITRVSTQFLPFPIQIMIAQMQRGFADKGMTRGKYWAQAFIGLTLMGVMSTQMFQISRGRNLYSWDNPQLWLRGFLKGGSAGLIGDLVLQEPGYGKRYEDILPAPLLKDINKWILEGIVGPIWKLANGKHQQAGDLLIRKAGEFGVDMNPISNIWYFKKFFDEYVNEDLLRRTNDNYDMLKARRERDRYETQY